MTPNRDALRASHDNHNDGKANEENDNISWK